MFEKINQRQEEEMSTYSRAIYVLIAALLAVANSAILNAFGITETLKNIPALHLIIPLLILMFQGYLLGKVLLD